MNFFDYCIETFTLSAVGWLVIEFIQFAWSRTPSAHTHSNTALQLQAASYSSWSDVITPFKRPVKPQLNDPELIKLAKSIGYGGSKKWSYSRKLSLQTRAELIRLTAG